MSTQGYDIPDIEAVDAYESQQPPRPALVQAAGSAASPPTSRVESASGAADAAASASGGEGPPSSLGRAVLPAASIAAGGALSATFASVAQQAAKEGLYRPVMKPGEVQAERAAGAGVQPPAGLQGGSGLKLQDPALANKLTMLVNPKQKGNPVLLHVKNVWWNYASIVPDYVLGKSTCALYLSLRYHALKPNYIYRRIKEIRQEYLLRVILVQADVDDVEKPLMELTRLAIANNFTIICAFSHQEAARYLEAFKTYEHKPSTAIQERVEESFVPRVTDLLTQVRAINKTDVGTLLSNFGSLADILTADTEQLSKVPGLGEKKVRRLLQAFHAPFSAPSTGEPTS